MHRVRVPSGRERLSTRAASKPYDGLTMCSMDELVDDKHPPLYVPATSTNFSWTFDPFLASRGASGGLLSAMAELELDLGSGTPRSPAYWDHVASVWPHFDWLT
ncbi:hypothetical protein PR202_gb03280 [Eleusine coracana subsp. coracana]|uniref:Uncharacterized protein n=1 Tax=Eleusine coracana subsp. coracana TaxID=191504 RepID=A0AAV5E194_ELECO|nr:hypothetical protein PR202_gb03199 [Eleusine coracana subsp. coracana]GJN16306.1 hypothetical protein PR202_gb03280 [Eleusine coracana subsp. coracana]